MYTLKADMPYINNQRMHVISSRIIARGHGKYKRITDRGLPI